MIQVAISAQELSNGSSVKIIEVNCHFRMPLSCNDNSCAIYVVSCASVRRKSVTIANNWMVLLLCKIVKICL